MTQPKGLTERPTPLWKAGLVSGFLFLFLELAAGARPPSTHADALFEAPKRHGSEAAGWYLRAAERAYADLFRSGRECQTLVDAPCRRSAEIYRRATSGYLSTMALSGDWRHDHQHKVAGSSYRVRVEGEVALAEVDRIVLAETLDAGRLRNRHRREGAGVPLVGIRENRRPSAVEHFYPPAGLAKPLTAVLRFDLGGQDEWNVVLSFYDPRRTSALRLGGAVVPLAAELTAPCAYQATSSWLLELDRITYTATEKGLAHQGLLLMEPYDPGKTPVLMVHGLRSHPGIWLELTNEIWGDPQLRDDFQVWYYSYPTGLPYLYSASLLREELLALRLALDPSGTHDALQSMVIVAHSMGGLIAKALVAESGTALWDEAIAVPPAALKATPRDVEALRRCFVFDPLPYVDRVVFISTPHRGSGLATSIVGRLGAALVRRARSLKSALQRIATNNEKVIRADMRKLLARGGVTSIRALSPQYPILRKLAGLPIASGVKVHTIVGDRGLARGRRPRRSDGVVTYASAHLDEAVSELVVPAGHDAYSNPSAIAEIRRILREHLRGSWAEWERHANSAGVNAYASNGVTGRDQLPNP